MGVMSTGKRAVENVNDIRRRTAASIEAEWSSDERQRIAKMTLLAENTAEIYDSIEEVGNWDDAGNFMYGKATPDASYLEKHTGTRLSNRQVGGAMMALTNIEGSGIDLLDDGDQNKESANRYSIESANLEYLRDTLLQVEGFYRSVD